MGMALITTVNVVRQRFYLRLRGLEQRWTFNGVFATAEPRTGTHAQELFVEIPYSYFACQALFEGLQNESKKLDNVPALTELAF